MKCLCMIPARGGSKRIPRKNIKDFFGRPVIAYSIETALSCGLFDEVMVSTDDPEIAELAKKYGAKVPFMRSAEAASDTAPDVVVIREVLDEYKKRGQTFDVICSIYPCAPLVTAERLKEAYDRFIETGADCVFPVIRYCAAPQRGFVVRDGEWKRLHPEYAYTRSQDLEPVFFNAGQYHFYSCYDYLNKEETERIFAPFEISEMEAQDIDNEVDWKLAEMKYRLIHGEL